MDTAFKPGDRVTWNGALFAFDVFGYKSSHGTGPFTIKNMGDAGPGKRDDFGASYSTFVQLVEFPGKLPDTWFILVP